MSKIIDNCELFLAIRQLYEKDSVTSGDPASSRLTLKRHRNVALKQPLAVFAPSCHSGVLESLSLAKEKTGIKTCFFFG